MIVVHFELQYQDQARQKTKYVALLVSDGIYGPHINK